MGDRVWFVFQKKAITGKVTAINSKGTALIKTDYDDKEVMIDAGRLIVQDVPF